MNSAESEERRLGPESPLYQGCETVFKINFKMRATEVAWKILQGEPKFLQELLQKTDNIKEFQACVCNFFDGTGGLRTNAINTYTYRCTDNADLSDREHPFRIEIGLALYKILLHEEVRKKFGAGEKLQQNPELDKLREKKRLAYLQGLMAPLGQK